MNILGPVCLVLFVVGPAAVSSCRPAEAIPPVEAELNSPVDPEPRLPRESTCPDQQAEECTGIAQIANPYQCVTPPPNYYLAFACGPPTYTEEKTDSGDSVKVVHCEDGNSSTVDILVAISFTGKELGSATVGLSLPFINAQLQENICLKCLSDHSWTLTSLDPDGSIQAKAEAAQCYYFYSQPGVQAKLSRPSGKKETFRKAIWPKRNGN